MKSRSACCSARWWSRFRSEVELATLLDWFDSFRAAFDSTCPIRVRARVRARARARARARV